MKNLTSVGCRAVLCWGLTGDVTTTLFELETVDGGLLQLDKQKLIKSGTLSCVEFSDFGRRKIGMSQAF